MNHVRDENKNINQLNKNNKVFNVMVIYLQKCLKLKEF